MAAHYTAAPGTPRSISFKTTKSLTYCLNCSNFVFVNVEGARLAPALSVLRRSPTLAFSRDMHVESGSLKTGDPLWTTLPALIRILCARPFKVCAPFPT